MKLSPRLASVLESMKSVCVLTGAGISAESGVPTFRGTEGLWSKFKPEELANFDAFLRNPDLVWEWYSYRRKVMKQVQPNTAHLALVELEGMMEDFTLVTQNVDNLHQRAGSKHVLELHGNIERSCCSVCGAFAEDVVISTDRSVPRCHSCNGLIRPDVVWFGELLRQDVFSQAADAARRCDLFLCIGTSGVVYPAASLPLMAREDGAFVVEINPEYTDLSARISETIIGTAGEVLPTLVRHVRHIGERS